MRTTNLDLQGVHVAPAPLERPLVLGYHMVP